MTAAAFSKQCWYRKNFSFYKVVVIKYVKITKVKKSEILK